MLTCVPISWRLAIWNRCWACCVISSFHRILMLFRVASLSLLIGDVRSDSCQDDNARQNRSQKSTRDKIVATKNDATHHLKALNYFAKGDVV